MKSLVLCLSVLAVAILACGFLSAARARVNNFLTAAFHAPGGFEGRDTFALANLGADSFASKRFLTDAAVATRYLLGKKGSDIDHIAICGAADEPYVSISDEATAAEKEVTGHFLATAQETVPMVASEAITIGDDVYTAAAGKVQDEPAVAGTYFKVGTAAQAASGDGVAFSVVPCAPIKVVVIAAPTVGANIAAFTDPPSAAEMATLRTFVNALKADNAALGAALATPALVKVLA